MEVFAKRCAGDQWPYPPSFSLITAATTILVTEDDDFGSSNLPRSIVES